MVYQWIKFNGNGRGRSTWMACKVLKNSLNFNGVVKIEQTTDDGQINKQKTLTDKTHSSLFSFFGKKYCFILLMTLT